MVSIGSRDLRKEFRVEDGTLVAVDSINLSISDGNFVTLVGPSGCGKTTLLRMIAGLETPTSGDIEFDDKQVTNIRPQDRNISMVFQNIALFPFKTVRKNIEYGLKHQDEQPDESLDVESMAEMLGIANHLDQKPNQLSGGQQQRVALARALIRKPDVFLLDEPMSDLDAQLKIQLRADLKELHQRFQRTTIYVTHDQQEAMSLSDEVVVMNDGSIEQKSPPHLAYQEPNNLFVAQFIGSPTINTFEASVNGDRIESDILSVELRSAGIEELGNGSSTRDLIIGIRPEKFNVINGSDDGDSTKQHSISARVKIIEQMGDEIVTHLVRNEKEIRATLSTTVPPEIDEELELEFGIEDLYLFDGETHESIAYGLASYADGSTESVPRVIDENDTRNTY